MLLQQVERIGQAKLVDKVLICTSLDNSDKDIALFCQQNHIDCFRGDLSNVLDRFYQANQQEKADHIVRLTGDCPLTDPAIIDAVISQHLAQQNDYTSNCHPYTLPDGLDVEIIKKEVLNDIWQRAKAPHYQEHVTLFINHHPEQFKRGNYTYPNNYAKERWTVDYPEDFQLVNAIYNALYQQGRCFSVEEIMLFLNNHPEIKKLNEKYISA